MRLLDRMSKARTPPEGQEPTDQTAFEEEKLVAPQEPGEVERAEASTTRAKSGWSRWLGPASPLLTYFGLILIAGGFGVIAFTWSKVAGLLQVPLQLPYIASGATVAIGLLVLGSTVITYSVARRDAAKREERLEELAEVLRSIAEALDGESESQPGK